MRQGVFMGKRQRRLFTEAFKQEAVRLCLRHDRSIGQVAREFDLTESALRRWVQQAGGCSSMRSTTARIPAVRSGPRIVDSVLSEISTGFQAAVFTATCSKYTASGVRRSSAV